MRFIFVTRCAGNKAIYIFGLTACSILATGWQKTLQRASIGKNPPFAPQLHLYPIGKSFLKEKFAGSDLVLMYLVTTPNFALAGNNRFSATLLGKYYFMHELSKVFDCQPHFPD